MCRVLFQKKKKGSPPKSQPRGGFPPKGAGPLRKAWQILAKGADRFRKPSTGFQKKKGSLLKEKQKEKKTKRKKNKKKNKKIKFSKMFARPVKTDKPPESFGAKEK